MAVKMPFLFSLCLLAQWFIPAALAGEGQQQSVYALVYRDGHTKGSWVHVLENAQEFEIEFAKDSDAAAIESLGALRPEILNLNATAQYRVYLVGELMEKKTEVREKVESRHGVLRLDGWYIQAPFLYLPASSDPESGPVDVSQRLETTHFLPPGEREDTAATKAFRAALKIHHHNRSNVFWIGKEPAMKMFLFRYAGGETAMKLLAETAAKTGEQAHATQIQHLLEHVGDRPHEASSGNAFHDMLVRSKKDQQDPLEERFPNAQKLVDLGDAALVPLAVFLAGLTEFQDDPTDSVPASCRALRHLREPAEIVKVYQELARKAATEEERRRFERVTPLFKH